MPSSRSKLSMWPRQVLSLPVRAYRLLLSPWLGSACRFEPTCSRYALQALERHGALAGSYLAAGRILRCQPWCVGGCDPVPHERPRLFSRLLPSATVATEESSAAAPAKSSAQPSSLKSSGPLS